MNAIHPSAPRAMPDTGSAWPTRVADLGESELLLLGAYRHWLSGVRGGRSQHFAIVSREFRLALSADDGAAAFATFSAAIRVLGRGARRQLKFHAPCCSHLGLDEMQLVAMAAACQQERYLLARSIAEWMVDEAEVGDLLGRVSLIASLMDRHGLKLPDRVAMHRRVAIGETMSPVDRVH